MQNSHDKQLFINYTNILVQKMQVSWKVTFI